MQVIQMIAVQWKKPSEEKVIMTRPATLNDETDVRMVFHVIKPLLDSQ